MNSPKQVVLDMSLLVGLVDSRDVWHPAAVTLRDALKGAQAQMVYPVRNNAPLLCSGVRFYNNSGGV